jgi:hypothetical protein
MPGSSSSNDNGRSLEYLITDALSNVKGCKLTSRALADQTRDYDTVQRIDSRLRTSFTNAAGVVAPWMLKELGIGGGAAFEVDRHSDSDPGVADITITKGPNSLGVSVKHNHDALSHPRPYSLADAMGLAGTNFETDHRVRMEAATKRFRTAAKGATTFPSLPAGAKLKLYQEACAECATTVNRAGKNKTSVSTLFNFLVGSDFKKVIVRTIQTSRALTSITVADYTKIKPATSVTASVDNRARASSLVLTFNNGWKINLRIKNAATAISSSGQVSLKFDAQKEAGAIPPIVTLF